MKKIVAIAAALLICAAAFAQDGRSIYNKYSDAEGVSAVYISPAMFRLMGRIPEMNVGENEDVNLSALISSMNGFFLIDSGNRSINASIKADADRFVKSGKYEMLMEVKDDGETTHIFTVGDQKTINGFVLISYSADECTFINIDGKMDREEVEKALVSSL